jgi:FkbM family methyltransferase
MNFFESVRHAANRIGLDICRIGPSRMGRVLAADLHTLLPAGGVIFDVGANTGRAARLFSAIFPGRIIWSFEPGAEAFQELSAAADLPHVKKFNLAFSDMDGSATLNIFQGSQLNSLLPPEAVGERHDHELIPKGTKQIQTARLDTFCEQQNISQIEILKIDTQGFELHVLRGAEHLLASGAIKLIYLEIHLVPIYQGQPTVPDVFGLMDKFGYGFVSYYDASRNPDGSVKCCDLLFVRKIPAT